jgi:hypothetical protein
MRSLHPTFDANDEASTFNETLDKMVTRRRLYFWKEKDCSAAQENRSKKRVVAQGKERKDEIMNNKLESTYILLARSEDGSRSTLEAGIFTLFALSAILAIWQFAAQPNALPLDRVSTFAQEHVGSRVAS